MVHAQVKTIIFGALLITTHVLSYNYDPWIEPPSPLLPRACIRMAIGYDRYSDTVRILGGWDHERQLVSLSLQDDSIIDHGQYNLSYNVYGAGQFYKQIDNTLWFLDELGTFIERFDLHTFQFDHDYISLPIRARTGCLTSARFDTDYLFVLGGVGAGDTGRSNSVQIFNLSSNLWLSNVSNMQQPRGKVSCMAHHGKLYAIGGDHTSSIAHFTIETLNISNLITIESEQWVYIDNLVQRIMNAIALIYEDDILVVGGNTWDGVNPGYPSQINVIDTTTDTVSTGGYLSYNTSAVSAIIVYPRVFVFGQTDAGVANHADKKWQYHVLPTAAPTAAPSVSPSYPPFAKDCECSLSVVSASNTYDQGYDISHIHPGCGPSGSADPVDNWNSKSVFYRALESR
eukprot:769833_1